MDQGKISDALRKSLSPSPQNSKILNRLKYPNNRKSVDLSQLRRSS
jgi:hypothetical protein